MTAIPADMRYSTTHEWVHDNEDGTATVGITDSAQNRLGDILLVELPELDRVLSTGEVVTEIEASLTTFEVHAPVAGMIVEVNSQLEEKPNLLNEASHDDGWIFRLELTDVTELDELMTPNEYLIHVEQENEER